jgi:hypothetical protein
MTDRQTLPDFRSQNGDGRPRPRATGNTYPTATRGSSEAISVPPNWAIVRPSIVGSAVERLKEADPKSAEPDTKTAFYEWASAMIELMPEGRYPSLAGQTAQFVRAPGHIVLFEKIMQVWGIGDSEAAVLLGLEDSRVVRQLLRGVTTLRNRDPKDRLRYIIQIHADLQALLRDDNAEKQWMRARKALLDDASPLEVMLRPQMENLVRVRQFVEHISGR